MKAFAILLIVLGVVVPAPATAQNTIAVTIVPGPFVAVLAPAGDTLVLTVDDLTGRGRGWWVTVACTCPLVPAGSLQTDAGDPALGPHWAGPTLLAAPGQGVGRYRQAFANQPGTWTVTWGQGEPTPGPRPKVG